MPLWGWKFPKQPKWPEKHQWPKQINWPQEPKQLKQPKLPKEPQSTKHHQTTQLDSKLPGSSTIQPAQENQINQKIQMTPTTETIWISQKNSKATISKTTHEKTKMGQNDRTTRQLSEMTKGQGKNFQTTDEGELWGIFPIEISRNFRVIFCFSVFLECSESVREMG